MLGPIAWRTPPRHYGPWEQVVSTLTEGLVAAGHDVTLYATGDSSTTARLRSVVAHGYEDNDGYDDSYDVAISDADRHPDLTYAATIHHGVEPSRFPFRRDPDPDGHVVFFGRIHPDKGTHLAIDIARAARRSIMVAGIVHDDVYFRREVEPRIGEGVEYLGPVGGERRAAVLGAATALLHPIAFEEPFGLSVAESMLCGTPVIAFSRGSMPEIVDDGVSGFLVDDVGGAVAALGRIGQINRSRCHAEAGFPVGGQRQGGGNGD